MNTNLPQHQDRLTALLARTKPTEAECLEWQMYRDKNNYGKVKFEGTQRGAHRVALYYATGYMGEVAMHLCDNPPCINPDHLRWGTILENNADMRAKNRAGRGEKMARRGSKQGMSKLVEDQVLEIRATYELGGVSQRSLAKQYGVSHTMIQDIIKRKHWTHI